MPWIPFSRVALGWVWMAGALMALATACGASGEEQAAEDPRGIISKALLGPGQDCRFPVDCPSRVCHQSYCIPLADAGYPWIEHEIAGAMRAILADNPDLFSTVLEIVVESAPSDDAYARVRVAGFLGALGDRRAVPFLVKLLGDESTPVSTRANLALLRLCQVDALEDAGRFTRSSSLAVRLDAIDAVASCGGPLTQQLVVDAIADPEPRAALRAIRAALAFTPAPPGLVAALRDAWETRHLPEAFAGLVALGEARWDQQ